MMVKKDGRRLPFDRNKVLAGLRKACQKRPFSPAALEAIADEVEQTLQESPERELPARSFFFSSRRRHTRLTCDWSSDVCSSDLDGVVITRPAVTVMKPMAT